MTTKRRVEILEQRVEPIANPRPRLAPPMLIPEDATELEALQLRRDYNEKYHGFVRPLIVRSKSKQRNRLDPRGYDDE